MSLDDALGKDLAPSENNIEKNIFKNVARLLSDHITEVKPDLIVCSGRSSQLIMEVYRQTTPLSEQKQILILENKINQDISQTNPTDQENLTKISDIQSSLQAKLLQVAKNTKIMFLDEYLSSGKKAYHQEKWFRKLGFDKLFFSFLCTMPPNDPRRIAMDHELATYIEPSEFDQHNIFAASLSPKLFDFVEKKAKQISSGQIAIEDVPELVKKLLS